MGDLRVTRMTNRDPAFYPTLGPFLARREVHRAVGATPWDDDGKEWFVAALGGRVVGFAGVLVEGDKATFCSDYVVGGEAERGVRDALMRERVKWAGGRAKVAAAVVSRLDRKTYEKAGFVAGRETVNYTVMRKELA